MPRGELAWRVDSTTVKACMSGKGINTFPACMWIAYDDFYFTMFAIKECVLTLSYMYYEISTMKVKRKHFI